MAIRDASHPGYAADVDAHADRILRTQNQDEREMLLAEARAAGVKIWLEANGTVSYYIPTARSTP